MHTVEKQLGDWNLVAAPALGGALLACRFKGRPVLRECLGLSTSSTATDTSAFPMVPFCGRIADGRFAFDGMAYRLEPNFPPEFHAIHGTGWQSEWRADATHPERLDLNLVSEAGWWPWTFLARQRFEALETGALSLTMTVTNTSETAMPAGLGWHPYFPAAGSTLTGATGAIWGAESEGATADTARSPDAALDPCQGIDFEAVSIDHSFNWEEPNAALRYPDARSVEISAGPEARFLTVFRPEKTDFVCVEPLTHLPNAVNFDDPGLLGLRDLAPGETLSLEIFLRVGSDLPAGADLS